MKNTLKMFKNILLITNAFIMGAHCASQAASQAASVSSHTILPIREVKVTLKKGIQFEDKDYIDDVVDDFEKDKLTQGFVDAVNKIYEGESGEKKVSVMNAVARLDTAHYQLLVDAMKLLSEFFENDHIWILDHLVPDFEKTKIKILDSFLDLVKENDQLHAIFFKDNDRVLKLEFSNKIAVCQNVNEIRKVFLEFDEIIQDKVKDYSGFLPSKNYENAPFYIDPSKYSALCDVVEQIANGKDKEYQQQIFLEILKVSALKYTPEFAYIIRELDKLWEAYGRRYYGVKSGYDYIVPLSKIDASKYSQYVDGFLECLKAIKQITGYLFPSSLESVSKIDLRYSRQFVDTALALSQESDSVKRDIVGDLLRGDTAKYNRAFIRMVKGFAKHVKGEEVSGFKVSALIGVVSQLKAELYDNEGFISFVKKVYDMIGDDLYDMKDIIGSFSQVNSDLYSNLLYIETSVRLSKEFDISHQKLHIFKALAKADPKVYGNEEFITAVESFENFIDRTFVIEKLSRVPFDFYEKLFGNIRKIVDKFPSLSRDSIAFQLLDVPYSGYDKFADTIIKLANGGGDAIRHLMEVLTKISPEFYDNLITFSGKYPTFFNEKNKMIDFSIAIEPNMTWLEIQEILDRLNKDEKSS